jgi:putative ABC transport system permease protein
VWRATWKSLLAKKLRLALTTFAVVLGVGFMAGTYVLTDTMNKVFQDIFQTSFAGTDVVVRAQSAFAPTAAGPGGGGSGGRDPIQESLLDVVAGVDGVERASGEVGGYAQFIDPATGDAIGGVGPPTLGTGTDLTQEQPLIVVREGEAPQGLDQVGVDASTAKRYGLEVGQRIEILFEGPPREFTITAIYGFGEADNLGGATAAIFDLKTAQAVLGKEGVLDAINVQAADGVSTADLRARIEGVLPETAEAVTASTVIDEYTEQLTEALGFFQIALLVFAFIALFVAAFIIFNTFSIITAQRTRELALLRALGATQRQVTISVLGEAAAVGLIASAIGIGVGILLALLLQALLSAFGIDLPSTGLQIASRTIVVSLVVGTLVTVVASFVPARRAAQVAPVEALREGQPVLAGSSLHRRLVWGVVITGLGIGALAYGLFGEPPSAAQLIGFGAASTFIGVAMLSPLAARPVARVIGAPLRRLGLQGRLGRENAMRNPRRTASTASALMVGLGLVAMVTILASSLKASFDAALEETLKADLTLTTSSFTAFSPEVADLVRAVPEVGAVSEFRQNGFRVNGSTSFITAVDADAIEEVASIEMVEGSTTALTHGSVLVHRDVAEENGLEVGGTVTLAFPATGERQFIVGGIFADDRLVGDWLISIGTYEQLYSEQLDAYVLVKGDPGVSPAELESAVAGAVAGYPNVEVQDQAAFREKQAGFIDQILGLVTALLAFAVIIALFGIVNTLSLSVFERTHEIGLLRAVGMTRAQVRSMVRWESVIIAVFGALLGIAIGIFFGFALQQALAGEGLTELDIPGIRLTVYVVLAALAGVLAAVLPARRAAKLSLLEAISYE